MNKNDTGLRRVEELKYSLERNNFLLSILTTRVLVCLYNDGVGEPDSQTSIIEKISPQYVNLIRSVRERFPNDSPEDLAQELYNMIYIEDNGYKRDYSHFRAFDEDLLNEWHILRQKQQQLFSERVALDSILADAQHAYYSVHGKDIEWREIEQKPEHKQQETEPEDEEDIDLLDEFEVRLVREKLLCQMFREGAIDEKTALEYLGDPHLGHGAFLKIVEIHTGETEQEQEPETKEKDFDYFEYRRKENEAKLLCKMYRDGIIDEPTALEYIDEPDWDHDTFMRVVDNFAEKEKEEEDE